MLDLNESKIKLIAALGEELTVQYFNLVRKWYTFNPQLTKIQFFIAAQNLCKTEEQLRCHNRYMLALMDKAQSSIVDRGSFEVADSTEYITSNPMTSAPLHSTERSAASEFFMPDSNFIKVRIELHIWENGLKGADANVAEYLVHVCQMVFKKAKAILRYYCFIIKDFNNLYLSHDVVSDALETLICRKEYQPTFVKNILTAMISKKESYKIRDQNFQYGFGFPVSDPLLRNSNRIHDYTQESKVTVPDSEDAFVPSYRPPLEVMEQQTAFAYSCGKRNYTGEKLSVKLLYETLKENPNVIGLHSINSTNLLKIGLQLGDAV